MCPYYWNYAGVSSIRVYVCRHDSSIVNMLQPSMFLFNTFIVLFMMVDNGFICEWVWLAAPLSEFEISLFANFFSTRIKSLNLMRLQLKKIILEILIKHAVRNHVNNQKKSSPNFKPKPTAAAVTQSQNSHKVPQYCFWD